MGFFISATITRRVFKTSVFRLVLTPENSRICKHTAHFLVFYISGFWASMDPMFNFYIRRRRAWNTLDKLRQEPTILFHFKFFFCRECLVGHTSQLLKNQSNPLSQVSGSPTPQFQNLNRISASPTRIKLVKSETVVGMYDSVRGLALNIAKHEIQGDDYVCAVML